MQQARWDFIWKRGQLSRSASPKPHCGIYLSCLYVLFVFYLMFLRSTIDLMRTFNGYLLIFHNSAVERHFLQANRQSRQSNAEAFRAVKVQPLIHCLTMSSRKICVGQHYFPLTFLPFNFFLFSLLLFFLSLLFSLNWVWKPCQLKTEFLIKLRLNLHFST